MVIRFPIALYADKTIFKDSTQHERISQLSPKPRPYRHLSTTTSPLHPPDRTRIINRASVRSYLRKVIAEIGFISAFIFMADVFNEMQVSGNVHLEFGGEMTGAIRQTRSIRHCQLLLGDRPIVVTIQRRASAMSWWTKLRLVVQVILGLAWRPLRTPLLTNAHHVAETDAMTYYIFVFERDLCLINALQTAAASVKRPLKIVAVVGGGHTTGIHKYWGLMRPSIAKIIYEPEVNFKYL